MIVTENQLDHWVRGNSRDAEGVIVELVWRLIAASSPKPRERRFPLGDSIGQHGPDGILETDLSFDPFVPEGRSFWEIGTGLNAGTKATADYRDATRTIPEGIRLDATFVFVTPLSGRRDWEHSWKEDAQGAWLEDRRARNEWRDIRVIDGTKLIDWIHLFPPVEVWLALRILGVPVDQLETPEQRWSLVRTIGEPPPLTPRLFLANRDDACQRLREVMNGTSVQLKLETHYPDQVVDFVSAYLADLEVEERADAAGRCLVISGVDAWNTISSQRTPFVLIADSSLDLSSENGTKLIQRARRNGHAVIFGGPAGGIPDPASVPLRAPQPNQVRDALEHAGYSEERSRALAQKSGGQLGSLLRCLQNLSLMPQWAESSVASELAIAALLGAWSDTNSADRVIVETVSGNSYGEWIGKMREASHYPDTPLVQRDGNWQFAARFEGWYALGPKLFDDHLSNFRSAAHSVLTETDPRFELPMEKRYASSIYGKVLSYSRLLRNGLADSLALLGSHPNALKSCSSGLAELTAILTVREILADKTWEQWASISNLLPLLAEAAPGEFLDAIEKTLSKVPCPFDQLFAQENSGAMGENYMSGVLWALETLAWDPDYLSRVVICLGELAARDPGGRWANRPANSLTTILLPWLPQTCAPVVKRAAAMNALLSEIPEIGWKLLVTLLPKSHSTSSGTRRPAWRSTIPEDWSKGVTRGEYWEQTELYAGMAVTVALKDFDKLVELIGYIENLPLKARTDLLSHLESDHVLGMSESERLGVWSALVDIVIKHRKFSDATWAMEPKQVDMISSVAERVAPTAPTLLYQRLFSERDFALYQKKGDYEEQRQELERRRQRAVEEIAVNGVQAVLAFAATVTSPWRVGIAFGLAAEPEADKVVLPDLLESEKKGLSQFAGGFVWSRFSSGGWQWVDGIQTVNWTASQIGQFLAFLPFTPDAWERSSQLLGSGEVNYWSKTAANPYEASAGLEHAVDELLRHRRPLAALRCLHRMVSDHMPLDGKRAVRALFSALESAESSHSLDSHEIVEIIKSLQEDSSIDEEELFKVEWAYLSLLNRHSGTSPVRLERRLATDPSFFCEIVRLVYRSNQEELKTEVPAEESKIATNAYRLLSEWRVPPGLNTDGSFDGEAFGRWLVNVREECEKTGHLEIAMTIVGHSMIHVPADPDGLWIHRAAATALNGRDNGDIRDGFRTELYNSRGVHWVDPSGASERELAARFRDRAEAVECAGYHRLATALRELAMSYLREADGASSRYGMHD